MENTVSFDSEEETFDKPFKDLRHDFKSAKKAKSEIDELILDWNDLYYGNVRGRDGELQADKTGRSGIVVREIAKQIEWQKPNIVEPFVSSDFPIKVRAMKSEERGRQLEKWANNEFTSVFDREEFINQMADVMLREGTVWIETPWNHEVEKQEESFDGLTMDQILADERDPGEITGPDEQGLFSVTYSQEVMTVNNPDAIVLRNEHVFPDPGARTDKDIRFIATIELMSISDLRKLGTIDETRLNHLADKITDETKEETTLGQGRNESSQDYGYDSNYQPKDNNRKHIRIVKYWGQYGDDDGMTKPIFAMWAEKYSTNLLMIDNPMPSKEIPIYRSVYSARPFSLWGNSVAFFLGDNQKVKNGITRGILDNMSLANNSQKFITKGALDYVNFKRMNNGYRTIIVNKPDQIQDGSYNTLPASVFNTLQMFTKESEDLVGVSSGGGNSPALSGVSKDGQQAQLTMSQQRMASLVRNLSSTLSKIVSNWISMAEVFLTDEQILALFNEDELADMNAFSGAKHAKVSVNVATEVNRNMKLQQYNMLMQQANALEGELPPGTIKDMVAEMYDLFGMHQKATELRLFEREPSPEEMMAQQLQLQNAQLENQKIQMEIGVMEKDVEARFMNAQARMMEAQANYGYKGAQTQEKMAKTKAHDMDTALKPVQVEQDILNNREKQQPKG